MDCAEVCCSLCGLLTRHKAHRASKTFDRRVAFLMCQHMGSASCRNFLKSYAVWFFPPLVLQMAAFTLSAAWGVLVFLLYWLSSKSNRPHGKSVRIEYICFHISSSMTKSGIGDWSSYTRASSLSQSLEMCISKRLLACCFFTWVLQ